MPWWVGEHVTCDRCQAVFELEAFDESNTGVETAWNPNATEVVIKISCANCGHLITDTFLKPPSQFKLDPAPPPVPRQG